MSGRRGPRLELDDIQGNVLRGYGMPVAAYVGVQVHDGPEGRQLLRELRGGVTDAREWASGKPLTTLNVALSYAGLCALDLPEAVLETFPAEFRQGMAARAGRLRDIGPNRPGAWERGLAPGRIHVVVIVHALEQDALEDRIASVRARVEASAGLCESFTQYTHTLPATRDTGREHFGYADGFGQPDIEGVPGPHHPGGGVWRGSREPVAVGPVFLRLPTVPGWRPVRAGEFVLGYRDEDGVVPPAPIAPYGRNGTFMVFRKLEQDVVGFRRLLAALAREHFSGDLELAAAKLVGRWRNGLPLMTPRDERDPVPAEDRKRTNDFLYGRDLDGMKCPLGAHIRRTNPRDALYDGFARTRRHRLVRRGMPYGEALGLDALEDPAKRGLIFVCFNASITRQFETVNGWCLDGTVFGIGPDADYLTGTPPEVQDGVGGHVNGHGDGRTGMTVQGDPPVFLDRHGPLVTTRGGEYLFLPGLTALDAFGASERAAPPRRSRDAPVARGA